MAGVLAGCAAGIKYTGVFVLVPALLAAVLPEDGRRRWTRLALAAGGFVMAVAVTNSFIWLDFPNFVRQLSTDFGHVNAGHFAATENSRWAYATMLADRGVGWPLLAVASGTAVLTLISRHRLRWLVLSFPIAYLWFMTNKAAMFPRWAYPLLVFVAVAGAAGLLTVVRTLVREADRRGGLWALASRPAAAAVLIVALAPPAWEGAVAVSRRLTPPVYAEAEAWLETQGGRVLTLRRVLALDDRRVRVSQVEDIRQLLTDETFARVSPDWIVIPERYFSAPRAYTLPVAKQFVADYGFAGNRGADIRIYRMPGVRPDAPVGTKPSAPR